MESKEAKKEIKRIEFFTKSAAGLAAFAFISGLSGSLFNLFKKQSRKVVVEINPDAVSRKPR
ncbi:MAG: hypothetical protein ACM34O_13830 [Ignavibacteria bacterium]